MAKRKTLGLTQQQLADKLNVSFQAVSKWENGDSLS
ncbi:MAG: helix-turn-helix transcriptional regulator [Lachnospiraceae bacterium]|nr:helix-turn-helix transcriptional regulator [Lachnospiraceae bacterium]